LPPPVTPAPVVQLAWNPSPDSNVTNYFIWYGVGTGQYTNKVAVGNVTNASVTMPARGATYFFVATAFSSANLESIWSNEVNWTPALPPGAPGVKQPVTLAVQSKSSPTAEWADAGMNWSLSPDAAIQLFRLRIVAVTDTPAQVAQTKAIQALHKVLQPTLPPSPGSL
jgi:hypothetical protein